MFARRNLIPWFCLLAGVPISGCALGASGGKQLDVEPPEIYASATYAESVGNTLDFIGKYPTCSSCRYHILFEGTFTDANGGGTEQVKFEEVNKVRVVDGGTLRWGGFGPHFNPLGGEQCQHCSGEFNGKAVPIVVDVQTGQYKKAAKALDFHFTVKPSIFVRWFAPQIANVDCGGMINHALTGVKYTMCTQAVGFEPTQAQYHIQFPTMDGQGEEFAPRTVVKNFQGTDKDCIGSNGELALPIPPEGVVSYPITISIEAVDAQGTPHNNNLAMSIHRPIELVPAGEPLNAHILEPEPSSSCYSGGLVGMAVTHSVTKTRSYTRTRTYSFNANLGKVYATGTSQNWSDASTTGTSSTVSDSSTTGTSTTTSDGSNWSNGNSDGGSTTEQMADSSSWNNADRDGGGWSGTGVELNSWNLTGQIGDTTSQGINTGDVFNSSVGNENQQQTTIGFGNVLPGGQTFDSGKAQEAYTYAMNIANTLSNSQNGSVSGGASGTYGGTLGFMGSTDRTEAQGGGMTNIVGSSANWTNSTNVGGNESQSSTGSESNSTGSSTTGSESNTTGYSNGTSETEGTSVTIGTVDSNSISVSNSVAFSRGVTVFCLPKKYCVFYEQATQVRYQGKLIAINACGQPEEIGEVAYNDWLFALDLAQGNSCAPEFPKSQLPEAGCYEPPCYAW